MASNEAMVAITVDEWKRLQEESYKLAALEGAGVDNWEGYDEAMSLYEESMSDVDLDKDAETLRIK